MKIRYLTGPKAGTEEHIQNQLGQFAIGAGLAEEIPCAPDKRVATAQESYRLPQPGDYKPAPPEWIVDFVHIEIPKADYLAIKLRIAGRVETYMGAPDELTARYFGREVPQDVQAEYARRWKTLPDFRMPSEERENGPHPENERAQQAKDAANRQLRETSQSRPPSLTSQILQAVSPRYENKKP